MELKNLFLSLIILLCFFCFIEGCTSSYKINNRSELKTLTKTGPMTVLTSDSSLYEIDYFLIKDSVLTGKGSVEKEGKVSPFNRVIKMKDILYIQAEKTDVIKTIAGVGIAGFFAFTAASYLSKDNNLILHENIKYPPLKLSCPFVYAYDGKNYYLESETFAGAIFKKAERVNFDNLYFLQAVDGKYSLKLTNERPETDYVNEIKLLVIDVPPNVEIVPDKFGNIHTISNPIFPVKCTDFSGKNVLTTILFKDSVYWESDISSKDFTKKENLQDGLILEFIKPQDAKNCKLVVNGINTALGVFAFQQIFKMKGKNVLRWYHQLETDSMESAKFLKWMKSAGMLHVKIWKDGNWIEQAALWDVGPGIAKNQVAFLDIKNIRSNVIKIKLESSTDLWKIDQVFVDYTPDQPVNKIELSPEYAVNESGRDIMPQLKNDDDNYYINIEGQYANLTFNEPPFYSGKKRAFVLKTKGYYHQWFTPGNDDQTALLNKILTEPETAGKLFYKLWKGVKQYYN